MKIDNRIFLAVTTALVAAMTPASAADVSTERTTMPAYCAERDVVCLMEDGQPAPRYARPATDPKTIVTPPVGSTALPSTAPALGAPAASQVPAAVPSTTLVPGSVPSTSQVPTTVPSTTTGGSASAATGGSSALGRGGSTGLGATGTSSGGSSSGR